MSRRFLRLTAALLLVAAGSAARADDLDADAYDKVRERGVLDVAVYDDFPPFSFNGADGKPAGLDIDIAAALARELGLTIKPRMVIDGEDMDDDLRNFLWKGTVLGGSTVDLMMHVGADEAYVKRQDKVLIFGTYLHESVALGLRANRFRNFGGLDELKGRRTAVELGSISDLFLSDAYGGLLRESLVRFPTAAAAVAAFANDKVDAVIAPRAEMQGLLKLNGATAVEPKQVEFTGLFRNAWDVGMAVKASAPKLKTALNQALIKLENSGELQSIYARYGLDYTRNRSAPVAAAAAH